MTRFGTVFANLFVLATLSVVMAACGGDAAWSERPPVPQPPTQVIGGIPVATMCEDLPDLTEADVAYLVARAEEEMPGLRVRRIIHSRSHPLEMRYVELQFDYHETHARIRRRHFVVIQWDREEEGGVPGGKWSREAHLDRSAEAEVCAPGHSFLDEKPVLVADIVQVGVVGELTSDEIVVIVDAVYDHVPAREKLQRICREDDGTVEVYTAVTRSGRSLSGSFFEMRRRLWGWSVSVSGEWCS